MGAWGTSLYANDTTCDIRGDYLDQLRRGKSNEETTKELILKYQELGGDPEEEPLFWFALADTQWNYGRLLPEVKEKALYFLGQDEELERWRESGEKQLKAWKNTLNKLEEKLRSPQPPEKKVSKYRLYQCKWKLGDVFAYRFSSEYSKEKGFYGQYIVFRKVSEDFWWPGHVVPSVKVYKWIGENIPELDSLKEMELLVQNLSPQAFLRTPNLERVYCVNLIATSKKMLPEDNLTFLGNVPGEDLVPFQGRGYLTGNNSVGWEGKGCFNCFESYMIDKYLAWKDVD